MLLNIWNCVYDNRNLFQKQKNWQGFLNISTVGFIAPQMIHTQCKMLGAELLLNSTCAVVISGKLLQWAFINATLTLLTEAKQKFTRGSWLWHPVPDDPTCVWRSSVCRSAWRNVKSPCPWAAIWSFVCFTKECQRNSWGRGDADMSSPVFRTQMAQTCLWLREGEGAAELPVSRDWWTRGVLSSELAGHQGHQIWNRPLLWSQLLMHTWNFQVDFS